MIYIYGLFDALEPTTIRYVGWCLDPVKRLRRHTLQGYKTRNLTHKQAWIRSLLLEGREPEFKILTTAETLSEILTLETKFITELPDLTNQTCGGEGFQGEHSLATLAKFRKRWLPERNTSGYRGIQVKSRGWRAFLVCNGKQHYGPVRLEIQQAIEDRRQLEERFWT